MNFGQLLAHYRDREGIKKVELASALGTGLSYVGQIESGSSNPPTIERLQKIRESLSLSDLEYIQLLEAAYDGRISQEDRKILNELTYFKSRFNDGKNLKIKTD
jgi:transcriptional regulator with XRE-family HTH domain